MGQPKNKGGRPRTGRRPTLNESRSLEGYYNHREVANLLAIHPDTVHSLTRINRIPVEKRQKGLPDASGNLRHDLYYPKDAIDALVKRLTITRVVDKQNPLTAKANNTPNEIKSVNGRDVLDCDRCGTSVPVEHVVSHDKMHRQQDLAAAVDE